MRWTVIAAACTVAAIARRLRINGSVILKQRDVSIKLWPRARFKSDAARN
jgi:hypothetical protein